MPRSFLHSAGVGGPCPAGKKSACRTPAACRTGTLTLHAVTPAAPTTAHAAAAAARIPFRALIMAFRNHHLSRQVAVSDDYHPEVSG